MEDKTRGSGHEPEAWAQPGPVAYGQGKPHTHKKKHSYALFQVAVKVGKGRALAEATNRVN